MWSRPSALLDRARLWFALGFISAVEMERIISTAEPYRARGKRDWLGSELLPYPRSPHPPALPAPLLLCSSRSGPNESAPTLRSGAPAGPCPQPLRTAATNAATPAPSSRGGKFGHPCTDTGTAYVSAAKVDRCFCSVVFPLLFPEPGAVPATPGARSFARPRSRCAAVPEGCRKRGARLQPGSSPVFSRGSNSD